jgi:hypothetical protein
LSIFLAVCQLSSKAWHSLLTFPVHVRLTGQACWRHLRRPLMKEISHLWLVWSYLECYNNHIATLSEPLLRRSYLLLSLSFQYSGSHI